MPDEQDYSRYSFGLGMAIEEVQRLRERGLSGNYKDAYIAALDEALIFLKAMHARTQRGEYPHPTTRVD